MAGVAEAWTTAMCGRTTAFFTGANASVSCGLVGLLHSPASDALATGYHIHSVERLVIVVSPWRDARLRVAVAK